MRFLFCSEFYYPSIGGVQEVMRHIAERLVKLGHEVTVATSWLADRDFIYHNGVKIEQFSVAGNRVRGLAGEVERFQSFMVNFEGDAILIKAAQQWTFDATWEVLDEIKVRKVFIPCGFSGLYEPSYKKYFVELPEILRKFDHLIFYAENYRDVNFAREHQINHFSIVPNGACEIEFEVVQDATFRSRHNIPDDAFLLLTVGSFTGMKGHMELVQAISHLNTAGRKVVLLLNGNQPPKAAVKVSSQPLQFESKSKFRVFFILSKLARRLSGLAFRSFGVLKREGFKGVTNRFSLLAEQYFPIVYLIIDKFFPRLLSKNRTIFDWVNKINGSVLAKKQVMVVDLPRAELVQAYMASDLFVFASNVEYSPLVLFESAAAGTPFLTVPVGNSEEIAKWTKGGIICPSDKDDRGYTRVDPKTLASEIESCMKNQSKLVEMGRVARQEWRENYSWAKITKRYEAILLNNLNV